MNIDMVTATTIAGISASIGAVVAAGITFLNSWLIRRSEERRQIRDLAVRAAIEEWKFQSAEIARRDIPGTYIDPLDSYLIHAMYFVQHLDGSLKTKEKIVSHIRNASDITKAADQEIAKHDKGNHK